MEKYMMIDGVRYELLVDRQAIVEKVAELAKKIVIDFADIKEPPTITFVLTGGLYLGVDLSRALSELDFEHNVDTVGLKRYSEDEVAGLVQLISLPHAKLGDRDLIIVEDLADIGLSLNFWHKYLLNLEVPPRSISYCTLFLKTNHAPLDFEIKYLGNWFRVGCG